MYLSKYLLLVKNLENKVLQKLFAVIKKQILTKNEILNNYYHFKFRTWFVMIS